MRFLLLILVVAPVLGTEFHTRERRQAQHQPNYQGYNQAPATIKQILAAQQARDPIVHLPQQPVPNLSPSRPIEPQYLNQADLVNYQPKVQVGQAPPQPTYKQIPVRPAQQTAYNSQPQYRAPVPLGQPQLQQAAAREPNYQYSKNLPPQLQQLVQFQQSLGNPQHQG